MAGGVPATRGCSTGAGGANDNWGALVVAKCGPSKAPLQACIFAGALNVAYWLPHKFTPVFIVACSALAGVILFF